MNLVFVLFITLGFLSVIRSEEVEVTSAVVSVSGSQTKVGLGKRSKSSEPESSKFYDVVLNVDSLKEIGDVGWSLNFHRPPTEVKYNETGLMISWIGFYDTGKTFTINRLLGAKFDSGVIHETKGLSILKQSGIYYVDTEGSRRASTENQLQDRLSTDHFIQQLALQIANVVVFHVDALFAQDVFWIKKLKRHAFEMNSELNRFVVVHNLWRYFRSEEVTKHVSTDIVNAFNANKMVDQLPVLHIDGSIILQNCTYYISSDVGNPITHIVMGRDKEESGKEFNGCAFALLQNFITSTRSLVQLNKQDAPLSAIKSKVENMLPLFFHHPESPMKTIPQMIDPQILTSGPQLPASAQSSSKANNEGSYITRAFKSLNGIYSLIRGSNADKPTCASFQQLSKSSFNLTWEGKKTDLNRTLRLSNISKLVYFPLDPKSNDATPAVTFTPAYDIMMSDTQWKLVMDVVDSEFFIDLRERQVEVRGCRGVPADYAGSQRVNSEGHRKYSTFHLVFQTAADFCPNSGKEKVRHNKDTVQSSSGVFTLTIDKVPGCQGTTVEVQNNDSDF